MNFIALVAFISLAQLDGADAGVMAAPPEPPLVVSPTEHREEVDVEATDGTHYVGSLESRGTDGSVVVRLKNASRVELPGPAVRLVTPLAAGVHLTDWFADPNRTRYLYGPSGMMLRQGELSFSQTELVVSTLSYGVTDWLTVQLGGAVPFWFVPPIPQGFNIVGAVKLGLSVTERVHLAVGAQTLVLPALLSGSGSSGPLLGLAGIAFGTATYGTPNAHVSLSVGVPFASFAGVGSISGNPIFSLSGNIRVAESVALITENWLIVAPGSRSATVAGFTSVAARIMGRNMAVDLGVIVAGSSPGGVVPFPIPWVNFTYNFGNVHAAKKLRRCRYRPTRTRTRSASVRWRAEEFSGERRARSRRNGPRRAEWWSTLQRWSSSAIRSAARRRCGSA